MNAERAKKGLPAWDPLKPNGLGSLEQQQPPQPQPHPAALPTVYHPTTAPQPYVAPYYNSPSCQPCALPGVIQPQQPLWSLGGAIASSNDLGGGELGLKSLEWQTPTKTAKAKAPPPTVSSRTKSGKLRFTGKKVSFADLNAQLPEFTEEVVEEDWPEQPVSQYLAEVDDQNWPTQKPNDSHIKQHDKYIDNHNTYINKPVPTNNIQLHETYMDKHNTYVDQHKTHKQLNTYLKPDTPPATHAHDHADRWNRRDLDRHRREAEDLKAAIDNNAKHRTVCEQ